MKKLFIALFLGGISVSNIQASSWFTSGAASLSTSSQSVSGSITDAEIVDHIKNGDTSFAQTHFNKNNVNTIIKKNNSQGKALNWGPFIVAAANNQPAIMTILNNIKDPYPNRVIHQLTAGGGTPVAEAARYSAIGALEWFKENLKNNSIYTLQYYLNKRDSYGNRPLYEATEAKSFKAVKWINNNTEDKK